MPFRCFYRFPYLKTLLYKTTIDLLALRSHDELRFPGERARAINRPHRSWEINGLREKRMPNYYFIKMVTNLAVVT